MYRWWRVLGWWESGNRGLKLGPITMLFYRAYERWRLIVVLLNRFTLYDGVLREMRRREYT